MSANGEISIVVKDVITETLIPEFKFIINLNNVGDPQVEKPVNERDSNLFPSLKPADSFSPVVITGEVIGPSTVVTLPEGKYLVSVLSAGYKMGGSWITVIADTVTAVDVFLQPNPLPLSQIRIHVFHDNSPVNGEDDFPLESGLGGFFILVEDAVGEVTVDYFGYPLGTQYEKDSVGNFILDLDGNPIRIPGTGGIILTDPNGDALIENIPPGKYGIQAIPPDGTDWIQTTTIEGTHVIDAWVEEGNDGYSPREGFQMPLVWIGFVQPMEFPEPTPWDTGIIQGRVRTIIEFTPPFRPLTLGASVDRPWIALTDIGANDQQVYTGRGDENGNFRIKKVPQGTYQMAIWDEPLDHIISFRTVTVGQGELVNMGDVGIPRWYGYIKGNVFYDTNGNAVLDQGEMGIPEVEVLTRYKDGSIQYSTVTDMQGNYALKEVFELERFAVAEVGFTRFGRTGATAAPDDGLIVTQPTGCVDKNGHFVRCPQTYVGALTLAELTWAAKTNRIDWGKTSYNVGENGGISGIVYYGTMRNELDPRLEVAEGYEPGIPHVTVNLYATTEQNGKIIQGDLINTYSSDAWVHPTDCTDANDQPVPCLEIPNISNQVRPGVYDGSYGFETYFSPYYGAPDAVEQSLPEGVYIVEVVPPTGFKAINQDGSVNTSEGDQFTPNPVLNKQLQNSALSSSITSKLDMRIGPPAYYEPPATPGQIDIHKKVVKVVDQRNTPADFFLYTDVPVPGRIIGFLLDDVNLETDPNFIYYGEKRGIPNTPVGIRDYTGRLITTVHSDINGIFEVLLPSTYTRNVPTPSGVAPGMYQVIGNDPGDPDRPNPSYNPNYQTITFVFDVWPGKTTYADVALFPITGFVGTPGSQFSQSPACMVPADTPQIFKVSRVYVDGTNPNDAERTFEIVGTGFGNSGTITLNGVPIDIVNWANESIMARVPFNFSQVGAMQLVVSNHLEKVSFTGITIHILNQNEYWPNIVEFDGTGSFPTIQDALDSMSDGSILVVLPGTYYESPILYKNIKLQGVGPGGILSNGTGVQGSVLDGRFFLSYENEWLNRINSIDFDGPQNIPVDQVKEISKGQVVTVVAKSEEFSNSFNPHIDGFTITGARGEEAGAIFINAHGSYFAISNNIIQSNGGGFGGGITIGKAYVGDNFNDHIHIHHNRIMNNGGISLAGGLGIFNGADFYHIEYNHICGNYSAEYGGGISHFGLSHGGQIHHNAIEFNGSFDEGAGIFIGGEQPIPPQVLTDGSGEVSIYNNLIRGNLANDDGGGIRLLQPRDYLITIYNNMIVNNVSTDLGGGIALDDASNVVIMNNTIAKNVTTATAEDSDGLAHGAGLISEKHSTAFQATLDSNAPDFSNPVLFNNIFWDNRAGVFDQSLNGGTGGIFGLGDYGEPPNVIDLGVFGTPIVEHFTPQYCILTAPYPSGNNNIIDNPMFVEEYNVQLTAVAFNMEPDFISVKIVTVTPQPLGDYHITGVSPAIGNGTAQVTNGLENFPAPDTDFDGNPRPTTTGYDIGADQYVAP